MAEQPTVSDINQIQQQSRAVAGGSHLFPSLPFRDAIQLIHELPSTLLPRTRGHLTALASMRYVLTHRPDGLEGLGGSYGLLHLPTSVKRGSNVPTLSARAGDRRVRGLVILWTDVEAATSSLYSSLRLSRALVTREHA
ncbi:hypothetical protein DFH08DRAFT_825327 [Mycena albidolilacea]|uniref:Uncharacterized protein n=1 Tax=Mycena albidolilacea TaxID=1033008 RepID=A0AAD6Z3E6_9AGAR|nr:hypothetical protein DFH08DRAFT_825327 [Mycena albidolilacea]